MVGSFYRGGTAAGRTPGVFFVGSNLPAWHLAAKMYLATPWKWNGWRFRLIVWKRWALEAMGT